MKHCCNCDLDFSDFLELCSQCGGVLKVSRKKSRRASSDTDVLYQDNEGSFTRPDIEGDSLYRTIFTGRMSEVEFVKEVLARNNIQSYIEDEGRENPESIVGLKVSIIHANQAEEQLDDILMDPKFTMLSAEEHDGYWRDDAYGYSSKTELRDNIMRGVFLVAIIVCLVMIAWMMINPR